MEDETEGENKRVGERKREREKRKEMKRNEAKQKKICRIICESLDQTEEIAWQNGEFGKEREQRWEKGRTAKKMRHRKFIAHKS